MPGITRRRLLLAGDPGRLTAIDTESAVAEAQQRIRELRDDVELTDIERPGASGIVAAFLVGPSVTIEDFGEIATLVRETLDLGAGATELIPEEATRGIGGLGHDCPFCGQSDGTHRRKCPNAIR